MHKLFQLSVAILDDDTFSEEEMTKVVQEALEIHVEAMGVQVEMNSSSVVIFDAYDMAEA
jgi:hypothetical protein